MSLSRIAAAVVGVALAHPLPAPGQTLNTRTVTVDGIGLRVRTSDLSTRSGQTPIVVFESGAATPLETWDRVLDAVAQFAPVVTYDRSGSGQSPWDGEPPTPSRSNTRLKRLLAELGAAPPYVMVGHSLGGALVRYFSGTYPADIAGILYVDPTDITMTHADGNALLMSIGAKDGDYDTFRRQMEKLIPTTGPIGAEAAVMTRLLDADPADRGLPPAPPVATSVILAGRVGTPPQTLASFDVKAFAAAMQELRVKRLRTWVTGRGTFDVASGAGHFVHRDDPQRVIEAIRALVAPQR